MALSIAMPLDFAAGQTASKLDYALGDGVATGSDDPAAALGRRPRIRAPVPDSRNFKARLCALR
jgi:hypothetical protein